MPGGVPAGSPVWAETRQISTIYKSRVSNEKKQHIEKEIKRASSSDRVNPERKYNTRTAIAEETIISLLMSDPSLYEYVNERIKPSDFLTRFNSRVFEYLIELLKNQKMPDISLFSAEFAPDEMGKIVEMLNKKVSLDAGREQIDDCVKVIFSDKQLKEATENDNEENWAETIKKITDIKRGSKK